MFWKLLVALDGTPEAAAALPPARALATVSGGSITLLRVTPDAAQVPEIRSYLTRVARELESAGVRVETVARVGDAAQEIAAQVADCRADLVVLAPRRPPDAAGLTTITERVLAQVRVPTLLVRPGGHRVTRFRTLLVPVDGTPGGALALAAASFLARRTDARLVLLQVITPLPAYVHQWLPGATERGLISPRWDEAAHTGAAAYVDHLLASLRGVGLQAQGHVGTAGGGTVPEAIIAYADEIHADLIVMSTHALVGPTRAALGSVAGAVATAARRPVLLVRREAMADRAGPAAQAWGAGALPGNN
jgi:nucleotide-binding universal stress UspA family protein